MIGRGNGTKKPGKEPTPGTSKEGTEENKPNAKKATKAYPFYNRGGFHAGFRGGFNRNAHQAVHTPITIAIPEEILKEEKNDEMSQPERVSKIGCWGTAKYPYFKFYFLNTDIPEFDEKSQLAKRIIAFESYFQRNLASFSSDLKKIEEKCSFELNYESLLGDKQFMSDFEDFESCLESQPQETLSAAGMAMKYVVGLTVKDTSIDLETYRPRIINFKPVIDVRNAENHNNLDHLISVRGTVMRLADMKLRDLWMDYKCLKCGHRQLVRQNHGKKVSPQSCGKKGCRNTVHFSYIDESELRVFEPTQHIRLQENIFEDSMNDMIYVDVVLKYDLVDELEAGDDVVITGILRTDDNSNKHYIEAVSLSNKNTGFTPHRLDFEDEDLHEIERIRNQPSVLRFLVNSLEPGLHRLEMVKTGLILSLFSGSPIISAVDPDDDELERQNIHVLMVGDPGMGKSELLNTCCKIAPKAVYSISSHMTGAGLTGTIRRSRDQYILDAGALALAHGGVCCVDEIDKKEKISVDFLEVMEQQTVTIIKMSNRISLPCRTTIIAAGNPVGHHYDRSKSVAENIMLSPPLLTRFDLIFVMIKGEHLFPGADHKTYKTKTMPLTQHAEALFGKREFVLERFLRLGQDEEIEALPPHLFQNYIAYARTHVFPKMTKSAVDKLVDFYVELCRKQEMLENFDITTRQFSALKRLCIARARVDLSDTVTEEHVSDVIELTRYSFIDILMTEEGKLEGRGDQGSGMSKPKQKLLLLEEMKKFRAEKGQYTFNMEQIKKMKEHLKLTVDIYDLVDSLNIQNFLMLIKPNEYKLIA